MTAAPPPLDAARLGPPPGARVVVAGGSGEIGRALVDACLAQDLGVAVLDLEASLEVHPPPAEALALAVDATSMGDVDRAFGKVNEAWGAVDGFVNLVGFTRERTPVDETDPDVWSDIVDGNLNGAFRLSRAVIPLLRNGNGPSIVHVASSLGVRANWGYGAYAAAKAGVLSLTRMIAFECAPDIRANAIAPTVVDTEFLRGGTGRARFETVSSLVDLEDYAKGVPLGRVARVDDIVGPVLFLLGAASRYMTGQALHVNGGMWTP